MLYSIALFFLLVIWSNGTRANESNSPSTGDIKLDTMFYACPPWGYFSGEPVDGKCYAEVSDGFGEVWTDGCSTVSLRRKYFNSVRIPGADPSDDDFYGEPKYDYDIYHSIHVSLVSGCSSSGANAPYETKEDSCEVQVGNDACNECSVKPDGKVTLVDCSNVEGVFSYLPQTVDVINQNIYAWFDVDIETEDMCNHPSVTGINRTDQAGLAPHADVPSTAPTEGLEEGSISTSSVERTSNTVTHSLQTELQYTFFPGRGKRPKEAAVAGLINQTMNFFDMAFLERPAFSHALKDIVFKHIAHSYTGGDVFDLTFTADIIVEDSLSISNREVADVIAHSDLNKYVGTYVRNTWKDEDHVFKQVHKVKFRGVSKA